jgi:hypothetical protein
LNDARPDCFGPRIAGNADHAEVAATMAYAEAENRRRSGKPAPSTGRTSPSGVRPAASPPAYIGPRMWRSNCPTSQTQGNGAVAGVQDHSRLMTRPSAPILNASPLRCACTRR